MSFFNVGKQTPEATEWRAVKQADEGLNDSDKKFTVPSGKEWMLQSLRVELAASSVTGDRQIAVEIQDTDDDVLFEFIAGIVQATGETRNYHFASGLSDLTSLRDTDHLMTPLASIILPAGYDIRVFDNNAVDPGPLGSEEITNGSFAADSDWAKGAGWTIASDVAHSDGTQLGDADLTQTVALTNGVAYTVTFTVSNRSAGNVVAVCGDTEGADHGEDGTFTEEILAGSGGDFDIRADVDFIGDIDNVSVKDVGDGMILQLLVLERTV